MNIFAEIKELSEEISNAAKRYQEYKEEYIKIMEEAEEFTYKTFKRSKEDLAQKQMNGKTSNRLGAICKVIHFTSKEHMQTKYIPVIEDGTSIIDPNIIEKYPYLSEFSRLFINAQYTVAKLGLNFTTEQILNMTIKYFIQIHQEQINACFASNPNEGFDRK